MPTTPPDDDALFGNPASALLRGAMDGATTTVAAPQGWMPPDAAALGGQISGCQVQRLIGRGGMGAVYQGVQLSLARPVAIKLLSPELAASADFASRFEREARTLARLQHPGIVAVFDSGRTADGLLYFIMEFVDGTDLQNVIHSPGLEAAQALELTLQICEALQYAHSQGVIHRDIKPANVLLTRDGRAKLADFGLARPLTTTPGLTAASMIMGTPEYMAPEQWAGKVDHRADIYALGVMLYEMLTGTRPHGAFDLPSIKSRVDARLDDVVIKAMRQAPEHRYQNVSELRDEVHRIRTTEPPHAAVADDPLLAPALALNPAPSAPAAVNPPSRPRSPQLPARTPQPHRRSALDTFARATFLVVVIALLAAAAWIMRTRPEKPTVEPVASVSTSAPVTPPASSATALPPPTMAMPVPRPEPPPAVTAIPPQPTPPPKVISQAPEAPQTTPPPATPPTPLIEVFTREAQNLIAWALSPLEESVPAELRQKLTFIREDLIDEGKSKPAASINAYREAYYLCESILTALNERDKARAAAGYRAAQTTANQSSSTQALEARRNYMMSWPQYEREQSQRSALTQQNQANTAVATAAQKVAWTAQVERLRKTLDARYSAFRAALRQ